jgi:hypothetical protein
MGDFRRIYTGMANNDDNWRTRLERDRDNDRKQIEDALNTTSAFWIIAAIIVVSVGWAIISTFI